MYVYERVFAQETFAARRRRVAERIGTRAVAVIQGARQPGTHDQFRQSNELFYLCGVEVPHAYLVIDGGDGTAALFLPHQDRHSVEAEGEHLSADNAQRARELTGVDRVAALESLPGALRGAAVIFTPLSPAEGARSSWDTLRRAQEEAEADPFDGGPAREAAFAGLLRQRCPAARIEDLSPVLDEMRLVKDEQEISVLREAGAICADALNFLHTRHGAGSDGVSARQRAGVPLPGQRFARRLVPSDHRRRQQRLVRALQRQRRAARRRRPGVAGLRPRPALLHLRHHPHVAGERHLQRHPARPVRLHDRLPQGAAGGYPAWPHRRPDPPRGGADDGRLPGPDSVRQSLSTSGRRAARWRSRITCPIPWAWRCTTSATTAASRCGPASCFRWTRR